MLKENLRLNAIAWKAKTEGISYGQYAYALTDYEKNMIYNEYEQMLERRDEEECKRLDRIRMERTWKRRKKYYY